MVEPSSADHQAQAAIASRLAEAGFALPGTLLERRMSCGKPGCRCHADPPRLRLHGPYHQWTRNIDGKTVTRRLTDEQVAVYGPWFANARRLRALVNELEACPCASSSKPKAEPHPSRRPLNTKAKV